MANDPKKLFQGGIQQERAVRDVGTRAESTLRLYLDPGIVFPDGTTTKSLVEDEIDRITYFLILVVIANEIPRRLGGDASDPELAADKRRCRRVGWALRQSLALWGVDREPDLSCDEEMRKEGIQMIWLDYRIEHSAQVNEARRYLATWALDRDPDWGRIAIRNLTKELNWVTYALR